VEARSGKTRIGIDAPDGIVILRAELEPYQEDRVETDLPVTQ
ncbi:MAG: hypothetical protein GTO63_34995, partial [Anaerolineae bacterium]|nr:hypothetical protein [Anaerolineae bacterium]NIN99901.1 hypothetical protein [Anaerolineae bacterium]NIQ82671.1 hypothetical protein [Anaerolineae bacterium]